MDSNEALIYPGNRLAEVYGDGSERGSRRRSINLGPGKEHTVLEMANLVNQITGNKAGIRLVKRRNWDAKTRLLSSIEKAKRLLGYELQMEFEDGLKKFYEWFVENWENIKRSAEFSW